MKRRLEESNDMDFETFITDPNDQGDPQDDLSKIFFTQTLDMKTDDDVPLELPLQELQQGINDW